ncbi:MAG: glycosyltransferase [Clostridia bacterium]|nr:glycosyltransferase [Clostridia bacterium]
MRVMQINATYGYGSTGLITEDIGNMLAYSGNEAYFAYQTSSRKIENGYVIGNRFDWKAHAILCRLLGKQGYYSFSATKQFLKYLDKIKPDVVHLHNLHSNYIHLNLLLSYLAKNDIATVITLHDCWFFTGKCFHYVDVGCDRFIQGCGECPKKKAPPASLLFDPSAGVLQDRYHYLSAIPRLKMVGCSQWIANEAKKGILQEFDISVLSNGVDTKVFKPYDRQALKTKHGLGSKYIIMGMANKWLLPSNKEAFEKIVQMLDADICLMLVGCTQEQMRFLEEFGERVIRVGFIGDRQALARYYNMADVFVNLTHADTLPTVNMESICCGTPVITYDSCGSPELIHDGCGLVVPENDVDSLLSAINLARKTDFSSCAQIGCSLFDKNICYESYLKVYHGVLNKS